MIIVDRIVTPGEIARELGEPQHCIDRFLNTWHHVRPLRRVGIVRAHALEAGDLVQAELEPINRRRGKVPTVRHSGRIGSLTLPTLR